MSTFILEKAISYHRKLRDNDITKSDLDRVEGIGEVKKLALLKHFGSVEKIKNSNLDLLSKKIIINLSPANTKKEGSMFDLPIAIGVLISNQNIKSKFIKEILQKTIL